MSFTDSYNLPGIASKPSLLFFPAKLNQNVPKELYSSFLNNLNNKYDVTIGSDRVDINSNYINTLNKNGEKVYVLSHSSGATSLIDLYKNNSSIEYMILIDPIDLNTIQIPSLELPKFELPEFEIPEFKMFNLDLDINELNDNIDEFMNKDHLEPIKNMVTRSKYNNTKILIINNLPSRKGKYFPFIPPINMMVTKLDKLKGISKKNVNIESYTHFDLLDEPWANSLNKVISKNENNENKEEYYTIIINEIESL
jgi:hypothetical protein|tara:strand:- start:658 stop:1419 length:762 start_codon:yes stop_codon:yes gene_type:complete